MIELMMFVHACFMEEVNNNHAIQRINWYISYGVLEKSVVRVMLDMINWSRGLEEW